MKRNIDLIEKSFRIIDWAEWVDFVGTWADIPCFQLDYIQKLSQRDINRKDCIKSLAAYHIAAAKQEKKN